MYRLIGLADDCASEDERRSLTRCRGDLCEDVRPVGQLRLMPVRHAGRCPRQESVILPDSEVLYRASSGLSNRVRTRLAAITCFCADYRYTATLTSPLTIPFAHRCAAAPFQSSGTLTATPTCTRLGLRRQMRRLYPIYFLAKSHTMAQSMQHDGIGIPQRTRLARRLCISEAGSL